MCNNVTAQKIKYSRENVFIDYSENIRLAANISGNHHLLSFIDNEKPVVNIFDKELYLITRSKLPFVFPEKSVVQIISFKTYYYLFIHSRLNSKSIFAKIDGDGTFTDLSDAFQKLQSQIRTRVYQLTERQNQFCIIYSSTGSNDPKKSRMTLIQTDSLLNIVLSRNAAYNFKRDDESLVQTLFTRDDLFVLKTTLGGTALEIMKINIATGAAITNTFYSSGFNYTQNGFTYNAVDSSITVYSLLREPRGSTKIIRYAFLTRLDHLLNEQTPFAVLKSQFSKSTAVNFLLAEPSPKWISLEAIRSGYRDYENVYEIQNMNRRTEFNLDTNAAKFNIPQVRMVPVTNYREDPAQGIRFSLLDKKFKISSDSLVPNNKNKYTLKTGQFARVSANNKEYLLLVQRFYKRSNGILMVGADEENHLTYTDIQVTGLNDYLLSQSVFIAPQSIIIPYTHHREAGLVKISIQE